MFVIETAKLCSCSGVLWEVEIASDEIGYVTEEGSKQSIKGVVWFLLTAYSKTWEERNELKKLSKKGSGT